MGYVFRAWRDREEPAPFQRLHPVAKEENKNKVSLEGVASKHRRMGDEAGISEFRRYARVLIAVRRVVHCDSIQRRWQPLFRFIPGQTETASSIHVMLERCLAGSAWYLLQFLSTPENSSWLPFSS
ncbi:hypothetical protein K0M31_007388 [Melipona bicolor]|uniref:Uncharacterized protein n=1 Tax=Melipona bicolor TaxID=60889 RepID=A0AA40GBK7_9HYME|nr:hypothetical protein K0M31_007388 [Melipona bicolor]